MTTAVQAVGGTKLGYIVQRDFNEFLSRNGAWTTKPRGIECAFVHDIADLVLLAREGTLKDAVYIYLGENSQASRNTKAKSAAIILTFQFCHADPEKTEANLNKIAAELLAQRRP